MTTTDRYSRSAVDGAFKTIRVLHRVGLTGALYTLMAFAMMPFYAVVLVGLNRLEVYGRERVPDGHGYFVLSNHVSMLDGQLISTLLFPRSFWFPSKADFYKSWRHALVYTVLTGFRSFPVRRGERDMKAVKWIQELLATGSNVLLFPEGTRSEDGELGPGKPGVGAIVLAVRPRVVPIYVEGFREVFRKGLIPRRGLRLRINLGAPVDLCEGVDDLDPREGRREVAKRAMESISALREELRQRDEAR